MSLPLSSPIMPRRPPAADPASVPPVGLSGRLVPAGLSVPELGEVRLRPLNASGRPDLDQVVAAELRARGIAVVRTGPAAGGCDGVVILRYGPAAVGAAWRLEPYFAGACAFRGVWSRQFDVRRTDDSRGQPVTSRRAVTARLAARKTSR